MSPTSCHCSTPHRIAERNNTNEGWKSQAILQFNLTQKQGNRSISGSWCNACQRRWHYRNIDIPGWSISRILSSACALVQSSLWAARYRAAQCSLPGAGSFHTRKERVRRRAASHRPQTISLLLSLAPGGGYLAIHIAMDTGGLLHHLFTITPSMRGLFVSVALFRQVRASRRLPRPGC